MHPEGMALRLLACQIFHQLLSFLIPAPIGETAKCIKRFSTCKGGFFPVFRKNWLATRRCSADSIDLRLGKTVEIGLSRFFRRDQTQLVTADLDYIG
jgi:hypothetical protein